MRALTQIFCAVLLGLAMTARAQSTNQHVRSLSLQECIQIALEHNLELKIDRYGPEIEQYNLSLAQAGYEPVLTLTPTHSFSLSPAGIDAQNRPFAGTTTERDSFNSDIAGATPLWGLSYDLSANLANTSGSTPGGPFENTSGSAQFRLRQPLLKNFWIDSTRMNIQVSKKRLKISELTLRQQIMNIVTSVELAYYDLILAQENVKVQEKALELAERSLAENIKRVEVGAMARLDEELARSRVSTSKADLLSAQRALAAQRNALKSLLSEDYAGWHEVTPQPSETLTAAPVVFSLQNSWEKGLTTRPDLLQLQLDLERQGIVLKFLYNQLFPQLDLVGTYGHAGSKREYSGGLDDLARGNSPYYSVGALITIPLGNRAPRSNYKIGKAQQEQSLWQLKKLEQDVMVQIDDAIKLAQSNFERVDATKQAKVYAESALKAEQTRLENGKSTSFIVLQLQRDLTAASSAEVQALADYNRALAQLALREGATLEKHKLNVEVK